MQHNLSLQNVDHHALVQAANPANNKLLQLITELLVRHDALTYVTIFLLCKHGLKP
jgi:hypothetical protein